MARYKKRSDSAESISLFRASISTVICTYRIAGRQWQTFALRVQPSGSYVRVFFHPVILLKTRVYFCAIEWAEVMKHLDHLVWAVACLAACRGTSRLLQTHRDNG